MRWRPLLIAGSIAPFSGCIMGENAARNMINEPMQFLDDKKIRHDTRTEAQRVWANICQQHPPATFSKDYERGFIDGYTDYLDHGGPGVPPAVPPRDYRRSNYLNPEGHARIRDWFAGFQYGIDIAKESGKRGFLTVPVLLPEQNPESPMKVKQIPRDDLSGERIPKPKPVDPGTGLPTPMRPTPSPIPTGPDLKDFRPNPPLPGTETKPMPPMAPGMGAMTAPEPATAPIVAIPAAPAAETTAAESSPYPPPRRDPSVQTSTRIAAPPLPGVQQAQPKQEVQMGRIEVSPVSEGLRLIVKPTREGNR